MGRSKIYLLKALSDTFRQVPGRDTLTFIGQSQITLLELTHQGSLGEHPLYILTALCSFSQTCLNIRTMSKVLVKT